MVINQRWANYGQLDACGPQTFARIFNTRDFLRDQEHSAQTSAKAAFNSFRLRSAIRQPSCFHSDCCSTHNEDILALPMHHILSIFQVNLG